MHLIPRCQSLTLLATLPATYPAVAAQLEVSCTALKPEAHAHVCNALTALAADAAMSDQEALAELAFALSHEAGEQLRQQNQNVVGPTAK